MKFTMRIVCHIWHEDPKQFQRGKCCEPHFCVLGRQTLMRRSCFIQGSDNVKGLYEPFLG